MRNRQANQVLHFHKTLGPRAKRLISLGLIACLLGASLLSHSLAQAETEALRQSAQFAQRAAMSCRGHMKHQPLARAALQPICPCGCSDPASPATSPTAPFGVGIPAEKPTGFATNPVHLGNWILGEIPNAGPRLIEHVPIAS